MNFTAAENFIPKAAILIHRHGSRTPIKQVLKSSPFNWAEIIARPKNILDMQLTTIGAEEIIQLAKKICFRYMNNLNILAPIPKDTDLMLRSSNLHRTKESLEYMISTIYPKHANNIITKIKVRSENEETLFPSPDKHEKICVFQTQYENSESCRSLNKQEVNIKNKICAMAKIPIIESKNTEHFYDELIMRFYNRIKFIDLKQEIEELETLYMQKWYGPIINYQEAMDLYIGSFLKEISSLLIEIEQNRMPKFSIFSAHDSTLVSLLLAFSFAPKKWPPPASYLLIEIGNLYDSPETFLRIIYNGEIIKLFNKNLISINNFTKTFG